MKHAILLLLFCTTSLFAATWETMPGASRAIGNGLSATRDAGHPSWQYLPRETRTGGADFGFGALHGKHTSLRFGFFGMFELESDNDETDPVPGADHSVEMWRGLFGLSAMISLDRFAEKQLGDGGKIEVGVSARHESDHGYDYSPYYYDSPPHIGDYVMPEAAVRIPWDKASIDVRVQDKIFLGEAIEDKAYTHGPGAELIARWKLSEDVYPFMSHYWEYLIGTVKPWSGNLSRKTPDNQYYRNLVGIVLPGKHASLALYSSMMAGNQKGQQVFKEQFGWGWGFRVVLFGS